MSANDPQARWAMTALAQTTKPSAARSGPKPYAGNCQNLFGRVFLGWVEDHLYVRRDVGECQKKANAVLPSGPPGS